MTPHRVGCLLLLRTAKVFPVNMNISGIQLLPGCLYAVLCGAAFAIAGCGQEGAAVAERSQQVGGLFAPLALGVQPGVAVMVIHNGEVVHQSGHGYADLERTIPIGPHSAFRLASVSKQFTAMAIMALAADGALSYEDPVSLYLPELAPYEGVTIRHLLTHTGGLPEYYGVIDTGIRLPSNADALKLLGKIARAEFVPGERHEYSNPGYDMLAPLVEAVSGMSFATFMQERVFRPAGMRGAVIYDLTRPAVPGRVFGYTPHGEDYLLDDENPLNGIVGSGGMYATLHDFFMWDQALYGETLVSRPALDEAFSAAALNNGERVGYGFGWRIDEYEGRRRLRHGGSWVGFRTHIARYPDDDFSIVVLSNRADFRPEEYIDPITDIYLGDAD